MPTDPTTPIAWEACCGGCLHDTVDGRIAGGAPFVVRQAEPIHLVDPVRALASR